jgi:hypothetical protein
MSIYIKMFFKDENGDPALGLFPVLTGRKTVDNSIILDTVLMDEIGDGWYKYLFEDYDPAIDYSFLADGGSILGSTRYVPASSFQDLEDVIDEIETPIADFD